MAVKRCSDVHRQHDQTLNARRQQSIVAIVTFTANGDDSYRYSGGTRRQTRGLAGKSQRRTIPAQIQDRVEVNQLIFQIGASILCTTPKLTPQPVRSHRSLPTRSHGAT
ncbi:hypothetical protein [Nostoc sp. 'Peltigera malacea cyanobiont' DB3992]|uniref:hypothetical protein n=1 Tax=Nostoc sp. 'Peltigera malacea cyanobiont' DB3992 TaxID=1206980 RepID=UPI0015D50EED|nr:hypothetical protein [Nostoc sp. 'Peltigera malacea cyanobiont' DB3992]